VQAVVLAGGEGTRLRPLTLTVPKPVMPLAGRPFLSFMLDWLAAHGVREAVLSCGFLAEGVERVLGREHRGMPLHYVHEEQPLGTAGPVRLAADLGLLEERVLVLNGDVLCDLDITAQVRCHEKRGARATLALVAVEDTASYGVVPTARDGAVEAFLEKRAGPAPTNRINAGAYVLEREVVDRIPPGCAVSFEREVFPSLVGEGLYGFLAEGYWIDIGTPERYLEATWDLLSGRVPSTLPPRDASGSLLYPGAVAGPGARVGPATVLGPDASVGPGSRVERSVLHDRARVGAGCRVERAVLADDVVVGDGASIGPLALVGSGATVEGGAVVAAGERVAPEVRVPA
jgi:mannose-1-phosphate guanylyltransferase